MKLIMPVHKYRVMISSKKVYDGDDLTDAVRVFNEALPQDVVIMSGSHVVTRDPLIEARDPRTKRLKAVLYGVTWDVWKGIHK